MFSTPDVEPCKLGSAETRFYPLDRAAARSMKPIRESFQGLQEIGHRGG